jgi:hypothetical protein
VPLAFELGWSRPLAFKYTIFGNTFETCVNVRNVNPSSGTKLWRHHARFFATSAEGDREIIAGSVEDPVAIDLL